MEIKRRNNLNIQKGSIVFSGVRDEYLECSKIIDIKSTGGKNYVTETLWQVDITNKSWFKHNVGDQDLKGSNEFYDEIDIIIFCLLPVVTISDSHKIISALIDEHEMKIDKHECIQVSFLGE